MNKIYIDYLRAVAAAAVVMIHVTGGVYAQFGKIDSLSWWIANILNVASRFAVPVFVMISGAVLLGKPMTAAEFYRKRAVRLLPPLIFWNIAYILFKIWLGMDRESLLSLLTTELWTEGKAYVHLWYLTMFACLMLFVPFINKFVRGEQPEMRDFYLFMVAAALFFFLDTVSDLMRELNNSYMYWHLAVKWYIAYFITGYAVDLYHDLFKMNLSLNITLILIVVSIGSIANYEIANRNHIVQDYLIMSNTGIAVFILSVLIFNICKNNVCFNREIKFVRAISQNSFGIYLVHPMFLNRISSYIEKYNFSWIKSMSILFLSTFFVSFLVVSIMRKNTFFRKIC